MAANNQNDSAFVTFLASSIHDMKNSLGLIINSLDMILDDKENPPDRGQVSMLQYESRRINNNLIQLLGLYKSENQLLLTHIDEQYVSEVLEDVVAYERGITSSKGITISIDCNDDLVGYLDVDLITGVLGNVLHNAIRYTKDSIKIVAHQTDDKYLVIKVIDNGPGFSQTLLSDRFEADTVINDVVAGTGLGLHFCSTVAGLHNNHDKQGYISLSNNLPDGGAVFSLYLP